MPYDPDIHGPHRIVGPGFHERVYEIVRQVPRGCVTTYGDVGSILGKRGVARQVGYALAALPAGRKDVPWHRVVTSRGVLSARGNGRPSASQIRLLRAEGIEVDRHGRIQDFASHRFFLAGPPMDHFEE